MTLEKAVTLEQAVILVDTSVWIDRLRGIRGRAFDGAEELAKGSAGRASTTEPIIMELLCGAGSVELDRVRTLIDSLDVLSVEPSVDYADAAAIFRATRANGRQARKANDCLIAAVALRHDAVLWHKDSDFEAIAAVTKLKTVDLR